MSQNVLYFLLFLFFAVEINASTTVLPNSTVQISSQSSSATPSAISSAISRATSAAATFTAASTLSLSYVSTVLTSTVEPHVSDTLAVPSPSSVPQGTTPTFKSTSKIAETVGFVLGVVLAFAALLTAFFIYYFVAGTRNRITGITDEAFVEDSDRGPDGSTKVAAPDGPLDGSTKVAASDGPPDGSTNAAFPDRPPDGSRVRVRVYEGLMKLL